MKPLHNGTRKPSLGGQLSMLARFGRGYMDHAMEPYQLEGGRYSYLFYLYWHDGATQDQISKALEMDKTATARAVQKLEDMGYVVRKTDEQDRRINHVWLTTKAHETREILLKHAEGWKTVMTQGLSDNEITALETLLEKCISNAHQQRGLICKKGEHNDR